MTHDGTPRAPRPDCGYLVPRAVLMRNLDRRWLSRPPRSVDASRLEDLLLRHLAARNCVVFDAPRSTDRFRSWADTSSLHPRGTIDEVQFPLTPSRPCFKISSEAVT